MIKMKFILTGTLLALAALALVHTPTSALAAKKNMAKVKGYISAIDTTAGTVEITDAAGNAVTVNVVEKTKIHKNNVEGAAIDALALGDKAKAKYNADTLDAKRIHAKSPRVHGVITAVGANSVTIENGQGVEVTVLVTANTKIKRNGAPATLADLVVGDQAKAKYDPTTMEARHVHASG